MPNNPIYRYMLLHGDDNAPYLTDDDEVRRLAECPDVVIALYDMSLLISEVTTPRAAVA